MTVRSRRRSKLECRWRIQSCVRNVVVSVFRSKLAPRRAAAVKPRNDKELSYDIEDDDDDKG